MLRQTVVIDTFFAFRLFLVEEQNFQLPLSVRSLLTWRARNPLVTVKIRVAGLSWARNDTEENVFHLLQPNLNLRKKMILTSCKAADASRVDMLRWGST